MYHAGPEFDTSKGIEISKSMGRVAEGFNLTVEFGVAPQCDSSSSTLVS